VPLLGLDQQVAERCELALAPDEVTERALPARGDRRAGRADGDQPARTHRRRFALHLDGTEVLDADEVAHQPPGRFAQQDRAGCAGLLETRGEVGGVADGGVVHSQVVADRADDHVARVEPHTKTQRALAPADRAPDGGRREDRALGMVLVGNRRAEERHEAIAKELIDRALVAVDFGEANG
jgi:hypothetical protein